MVISIINSIFKYPISIEIISNGCESNVIKMKNQSKVCWTIFKRKKSKTYVIFSYLK